MFVTAAVHWALILAQPAFPTFLSYSMAVNATAIVAITLGLKGHAQRTGTSWLPGQLWPFAAIVFAAFVFLLVGLQHKGASTALIPLFFGITLIMSCRMILVRQGATVLAEWMAASIIMIFAVTQLVVAWLALMQGAAGDQAYRDLYVHWSFLTLPAGYVSMAIVIILMLAADISAEMKELAIRDKLTGLLNRRGLSELAAQAYASAVRANRSITVIASDIDHFKAINDEHGHTVGDLALVQYAQLLTAHRRVEDIVARMGGEEFLIVLPGISLEKGLSVADELCTRMAATPLQASAGGVAMTASFGVASMSDRDTCLTDVIVRADEALYRSKRGGRNRVDLDSSQYMRAMDGSLTTKSL